MSDDDIVPYEPGMTLMPGQSTQISVPVPPEVAEALRGYEGPIVFQEAPPPRKSPFYQRAADLGIPSCLRVVDASGGEWRCGSCRLMQDRRQPQVWVPDFLRRGELLSAVMEQARLNCFNGHFGAWCVKCAKGFEDDVSPTPEKSDLRQAAKSSWWTRFFARSKQRDKKHPQCDHHIV